MRLKALHHSFAGSPLWEILARLHRIGANDEQLPINSPKVPGPLLQQDGPTELNWGVDGSELGRYANPKHRDDDDFGQAGSLYREVMDDEERDELVENVVGHASAEVSGEVQDRVVAYWTQVAPNWARGWPPGWSGPSRRRPRLRPRCRATSKEYLQTGSPPQLSPCPKASLTWS